MSIAGIDGYCPDGAAPMAAAAQASDGNRDALEAMLGGPVRGRRAGVGEGAAAAKDLVEQVMGGTMTAAEFDQGAREACVGKSGGFVGGFTGTVTSAVMRLNAPPMR